MGAKTSCCCFGLVCSKCGTPISYYERNYIPITQSCRIHEYPSTSLGKSPMTSLEEKPLTNIGDSETTNTGEYTNQNQDICNRGCTHGNCFHNFR